MCRDPYITIEIFIVLYPLSCPFFIYHARGNLCVKHFPTPDGVWNDYDDCGAGSFVDYWLSRRCLFTEGETLKKISVLTGLKNKYIFIFVFNYTHLSFLCQIHFIFQFEWILVSTSVFRRWWWWLLSNQFIQTLICGKVEPPRTGKCVEKQNFWQKGRQIFLSRLVHVQEYRITHIPCKFYQLLYWWVLMVTIK